MALWPALDVRSSRPGALDPVHAEFVLAAVHDFGPTAAEEHSAGVRVFFATAERRDAAGADLAAGPLAGILALRSIEVADDDWARRSQADLQPVRVGRITIHPNPDSIAAANPAAIPNPSPVPNPPAGPNPESRPPNPDAIALVIPPSMGFGTGHHATTRLCLEALQTIDLRGAVVLDVGTGSGILAIAASRLGAARAIGIDNDAHALTAARESLALNPDARGVTFEVTDLDGVSLPAADVVAANLTGALLVRAAPVLAAAVRPGGALVLSGLMLDEIEEVRGAFAGCAVEWQREEREWAAMILRPENSVL